MAFPGSCLLNLSGFSVPPFLDVVKHAASPESPGHQHKVKRKSKQSSEKQHESHHTGTDIKITHSYQEVDKYLIYFLCSRLAAADKQENSENCFCQHSSVRLLVSVRFIRLYFQERCISVHLPVSPSLVVCVYVCVFSECVSYSCLPVTLPLRSPYWSRSCQRSAPSRTSPTRSESGP